MRTLFVFLIVDFRCESIVASFFAPDLNAGGKIFKDWYKNFKDKIDLEDFRLVPIGLGDSAQFVVDVPEKFSDINFNRFDKFHLSDDGEIVIDNDVDYEQNFDNK